MLSLDIRVQYVLEHEAAEAMRSFRAKAAGGIVMNVHTGEIWALASLPDYEPNLRKLGAGDSIRNRMTQDVYELGSIFKIFAFTEAVEEKTIRLDEPIFRHLAVQARALPDPRFRTPRSDTAGGNGVCEIFEYRHSADRASLRAAEATAVPAEIGPAATAQDGIAGDGLSAVSATLGDG